MLDDRARQPAPARRLVFGARAEVERIERYHREHDGFECEAPLFGARSLFCRSPA